MKYYKGESGNFFIYLNTPLEDGRNRFYSSFISGIDEGVIMARDDDNHTSNLRHVQCISACFIDKIKRSDKTIFLNGKLL